jgi:2,3,4,5-tetrahydropyridine-2,6-dicarboxylate N-succinyltransferase
MPDRDHDELRHVIETAWEDREAVTHDTKGPVREAVLETLERLDAGTLRVASRQADGAWVTHQWAKQAILLYFRLTPNRLTQVDAPGPYWDKVPLKFTGWDAARFAAAGFRCLPGVVARKGAYIAKGVVMTPSFINIGAYVGEGTMVDTWATIGSCAQIGKHCHISGGAGIGGVLEPLQANPTIIEDNCFIGARSEIVEGVIVGEGSVVSMGVYIGQSTKIYNRATGEVSYGAVPPGSVVVPGSLPGADGRYSLYCAVIIKQVDAKTRAKTGINELLRGD